MDVLEQSALLVAGVSFALGISVLARNLRNKLYLAFGALALTVSGWAMAFFLSGILENPSLYRLHLLLNVWLPPAGLAFIRLMIRIRDPITRRLTDAAVFIALVLTGALVLHLEVSPAVLAVVTFAPVLIVIQTLRLMQIDRRLKRQGTHEWQKRPAVGLGYGRRRFIYLGALFVLCTSVMDHVPELGHAVPALGNLGLAAYLFFLSQAITHQRLLNFEAMLSRFLVLLVIALTLTGIYSLLFALIADRPTLFFLNSFIVSFLILMLLDPLSSLVRYFTHRFLGQKQRRLEKTLRESQMRMAGIVEMASLFREILVTVEQTLHPQRASLYVLRGDGTRFIRARFVEGAVEGPRGSPPPREVMANHALLQYCEQQRKRGALPVALDQVIEAEIDRAAGRSVREHLAALGQGLKAMRSNLVIPLFDGEAILGFLALHVPAPPDPWGNNWGFLQTIHPYFEQAGRALRNMEIYARQREKDRLAELGEMAAGLAHEIRNPLGAIKGAAQLLQGDSPQNGADSRFLPIIIEEVDRLNRVVTQFLDYSKPDSSDRERVDVNEVAAKTVELVRSGAAGGVTLEFLPAPEPATVSGVGTQIQQLILNLVQNGLKAVDEAGRKNDSRVRIEVGLKGPEEGRDVIVNVEDNGPGIKAENLDKIFIPFFTTSPNGTGLGLSICQKIAETHRGRIEVESQEGQFTRFSVILPHDGSPGAGRERHGAV